MPHATKYTAANDAVSARLAVLLAGTRPLVMGILNVTPDSFSDGGSYGSVDNAVDRARAMIEEGADIIDIGGESTRPGSLPVDISEERRRVMPVIERIAAVSKVPMSIDTTKSVIAAEAVAAGAVMVNDISALGTGPDMTAVVRETGAYVVLMHMRGTPTNMQDDPSYVDVVGEVYDFLSRRAEAALNGGIAADRIIVDPGIGFGKTLAHNLALLQRVARFRELGYPVLVGASRKGMIGTVTGAPVSGRVFGTAAIVAHCVLNGVAIHRVHDVRAMREVCDMAAAIRDVA